MPDKQALEASNTRTDGVRDVTDGVLEDRQTLADPRLSAPAPRRVLKGVHEALGVRHQAKDEPASVANARDVVAAAIGIVWELPTCG
jgi:hypothetical protein